MAGFKLSDNTKSNKDPSKKKKKKKKKGSFGAEGRKDSER